LAMDRTRSVMLGTMSFVGSIGIMLFGEGWANHPLCSNHHLDWKGYLIVINLQEQFQ
jgi:hypothetical protein